MQTIKRISFLGLGVMGSNMAVRLVDKGEVTVWTRSPEKSEEFIKNNPKAQRAVSAASAISSGDFIFVMLTDLKSIENTLFSESKKNLHGKTIIQMSTIGSEENVRISEEVISNGGFFLECPVLGSALAAKNGTLQLLVSGLNIYWEPIRDCLESLGKIRVIGEQVGQSSILKLALNQIIGAQIAAISASLSIIKSGGIPVETFWNIMKENGTFFFPYFDIKFKQLNERNYENPTFSAVNFLKDMNLVIEQMKSKNLDASSVEGVQRLLDFVVENGYAEDDMSCIIEGIFKHKKGE